MFAGWLRSVGVDTVADVDGASVGLMLISLLAVVVTLLAVLL